MQLTSENFNQLTPAQTERLAILIEECSEVQKAACKILRHGYESNNNGELPETNREALAREMGDLYHSMARLSKSSDVDGVAIAQHARRKSEEIKSWLHHQDDGAC